MMVEAIAIIPITCSQLMGMQYLVPTKLTKIYTKAIVIGAIINFVINIPLIFLWNAVGTAVATFFPSFSLQSSNSTMYLRKLSHRELSKVFWN